MRQDLLLETMWEDASAEEFSALWQAEVEEMSGKTRSSTLYLVTGLLLPVWDRLPDDHVQVCRLNTDDGQSFLGRIVPAPLVSKLADAFGIAAAITVSDADSAKHVMSTGETTALGPYWLKRSLVAAQQRLELLDWPHTRLPELKATGCFTEIIQHKTRMFVPVATAATVIDRITDRRTHIVSPRRVQSLPDRCYRRPMQNRVKSKWRADRGARAIKTVSQIEAEVAALNDEDLLDLYDIFAGSTVSELATLASAEMQRRNLSS
jgi:hypothetical protein